MAESAPTERAPLRTHLFDALVVGALLLALECLLVALIHRAEFVGIFELGHAALWLLPLAWVMMAPFAAGAAVLSWALAARPPARRIVVALALALALPVAVGVSGGRLLAGGWRLAFVLLVAAMAMAVAWWGSAPLAALLTRLRRRGRGWLWAAVGGGVLALQWLNHRLLVRRYSAFHLGLAVLTLWLMALIAWRQQSARKTVPRRHWLLTASAALVCLALAAQAPTQLAHRDNIKLIYRQGAPLLGRAVQLLGRLQPSPTASTGGDISSPAVIAPSLDLRGHDILLITIDALRADRLAGNGYPRRTTPNIDALALSGVSFEAAYTPTPHTSYAMTSLMTGKPMRSLLRQGLGGASETAAQILRRYDYRTAAFYPPALFFIDTQRFTHFHETGLGFEYRKVEFASAAQRVAQLRVYLDNNSDSRQRVFAWVHLFEPHEPYQRHDEFPFGDLAIERYDAEVAAADAGVAALVQVMRARRPNTLVVVTADHGEEFGDHGGHFHGTTVYDEQVRVPLIIELAGTVPPARVTAPVSLIDLLPTLLNGLRIPISPRISGQDLAPLMLGGQGGKRFAFAETESQVLLAQDNLRLICHGDVGACRLFDTVADVKQQKDVSETHVSKRAAMQRQLADFRASLGHYEDQGESKFPRALRRALAGDRQAAMAVAGLLDDADVSIRRTAAQALFELQASAALPHLRRALRTDEDGEVRRYAALALTRMGEGAPLVFDMLDDEDIAVRRLAALTLAEQGNDRGEVLLVRWLRAAYPAKPHITPRPIEHQRAKQLIAALGRIESRLAIAPLTRVLQDVRLRIPAAHALAAIGENAARPALADAFAVERYPEQRTVLAEALVTLGGGGEIHRALTHFLGVPEPLPNGLALAERAKLLQLVGGPRPRELRRLREFATSGVTVGLVVPKTRHSRGLRVIVRGRATTSQAGEVRFGLANVPLSDGDRNRRVPKRVQTVLDEHAVTLRFEPSDDAVERYLTLPKAVAERVRPGEHGDFVLYATQNMRIDACAVLPLRDELAPPPPAPSDD